jgi:hypothetical protein
MVFATRSSIKDPSLFCVDGEATLTADTDGILFVGALAGNDLGETYETRHESIGDKLVTVTSSGVTAPTFDGASVTPAQLSAVRGDAIELTGRHVILTLPSATARADVATIGRALQRLDAPHGVGPGRLTCWPATQFQRRYGWDFYASFFRALNGYSHGQVPGGSEGWHFVHDLFEQTADEDITPLFVAWDVPHPD